MDQKGFSLVEIIIVIAIMTVLIGVLAPQYLKFVNNARVTTDVTNATEIAKLVNGAISESYGSSVPNTITGSGGTLVSGVPGLEVLPPCKVNPSYIWVISSEQGKGVTQIALNGLEIFPDAEGPGGYYTTYYTN